MNITVERIVDNVKEEFKYYFLHGSTELALSQYIKSVKEKGKRSFTPTHIFLRNPYNGYDNTKKGYLIVVKRQDVPETEDIKKEALQKFINQITFI